MITCKELADFLGAYLDGELAGEELAEFNLHLAQCPWCVAYLKSYEETRLLGRAAFTDPAASAPPDVPEQLVDAILAARKKSIS